MAALVAEPVVQTVARICKTFQLDPVDVLRSTDEFELQVRLAATRVIQDDERKSNEASKRGRKR